MIYFLCSFLYVAFDELIKTKFYFFTNPAKNKQTSATENADLGNFKTF